MARNSNGVNKSEQVRHLLKDNPDIGSKEALAALAEKGVQVSSALFHYVKGHVKGRKSRKTRAQKAVTKVAASTHGSRADAVTIVLKVKGLANEVGGMKSLRELVEALSD